MTEEKALPEGESNTPTPEVAKPEADAAASKPEEEGERDADGNHVLEYKWTLWFDSHQKGQSQTTYGQTRRRVYTFNTVEDFWKLFNNIKGPSEFSPNTDYCLFKEGIEPEWEDPRNDKGGSWTISPKDVGRQQSDVDEMWLQAVMACIGDQFEESDEICGLMVSVRARGNRMQLWTRTASNEEAQLSIARQMKEHLSIPSETQIAYNSHSDQMKGDRRSKEKYVA
ncbi:unnamed protein product [Ostreobium quekettii]|uniref:eIF-4F 25 kDa subunit n=1 Tax=Ostreobium quekettii TaxID=121088 RepID=A0A8S1IMV8_9CHLO|nr:unnamed protein product [Ostreobium quekettii]|eukprot:evm.model.scf_162EXC.10 EVM.evm.TU.scf_162EXC.10   scf_162EXC:66097-66774(-)